jgi:hypothetical protein
MLVAEYRPGVPATLIGPPELFGLTETTSKAGRFSEPRWATSAKGPEAKAQSTVGKNAIAPGDRRLIVRIFMLFLSPLSILGDLACQFEHVVYVPRTNENCSKSIQPTAIQDARESESVCGSHSMSWFQSTVR